MSERTFGTRGHTWVAVIAAIAALAIGLLGGTVFRRAAPTGRPTQTVIDFLSQSLPTPAGAKQLPVSGIGGQGVGEGTVSWRKGVVLDVTEMAPKDIAAIPMAYLSHFNEQFPFGSMGHGNHQDLWKSWDDEFGMAWGADWTWRWKAEYRGTDFDLIMDVEVMDFDQVTPDSSGYSRLPVRELDDPVRGQRILWMRLDFQGRNLTGAGKWPGM